MLKRKESIIKKEKLNRSNRLWLIIIYTTLILWITFSILSLVWIIFTSFKSNREIYAGIWSLPKVLHFENYVKAWNVVNLKRYFLNSVIITFISIFGLTFL